MQLVCIAFSHKRTPINTLTHLWDRSPSDKYCHQPISRSLPFPLEPKVIVIAYDGTGWWWEADNQEVGVEPRLISLANADMLTQKQSSKVINGVKTEVVLQPFADRILILITQLGKVGNLIQASIPQTAPLLAQPSSDEQEPNAPALPPPPPSIQLTPLLGSAPTDHLRTLHGLYASQVATMIWIAEAGVLMDERRRSVVLGLALKKSGVEEEQGLSEAERQTFHQIMSMVRDLVKG